MVCAWLGLSSLSALWRVLERLGIRLKRGRSYVHSPDPFYEAKLNDILKHRQEAAQSGGKIIFLYMDEFGYGRHPEVAYDYEEVGKSHQPLAQRSHHAETETRVVGAVDVETGRVFYQSRNHIRIPTLVGFFQEVRAAYPEAEKIYIGQDNWPVHAHPDVLVALEKQESPFERKLPASWPKEASPGAKRKYGELQLPIQLLPLPTYASWTNPIEKLWRKLRQEKLHQHRWAEQLEKLRAAVNSWLDQFKTGSQELLHELGLRP